jgi:hypothetical protein
VKERPTTCPVDGAPLRWAARLQGPLTTEYMECPRSRWHDRFRKIPDVEHVIVPGRHVVIYAEWQREPSWGRRYWESGVGRIKTGMPLLDLFGFAQLLNWYKGWRIGREK